MIFYPQQRALSLVSQSHMKSNKKPFFQVFASNSLLKNVFEEEKKVW